MRRNILALAILGSFATAGSIQAELRAVALIGGSAPNTTAGERFHDLRNMQFNNRGEVAFFAHLSDSAGEPIYFRAGDDPMYDLTPDVGVWVVGPDGSQIAARQGMAAPDSPAGTRLWLIDPTDSDDGRYDYRLSNAGLLLKAHLEGGNNSPAIWMMPTQGDATRILAAGDPDAASGLEFHDLQVSYLSDSGYALFKSGLRQPGDPNLDTVGYGQWVYSPTGVVANLVRSGSPAVGLPAPTVYDSMFFSHGVLTEQGVAVFDSELASSPDDVTLDSWSSSDPNGIWRGMNADQLSLVALSTGQDASGVSLFPFRDPRTNERGDIAAVTRNGNGAIVIRAGVPQVLARESVTPGAPDKIFSGVEALELSETGKVAFTALMRTDDSTPYGRGLWQDDGSGLTSVIVPEQLSPAADGSVFASVEGNSLSMNASGQIAIIALVRDVGSNLQQGLFAQDREGNLVAIAVPGQTVQYAPGDERILVAVTDARINDVGQIAFFAHFQGGGQGIFISDVVAVPEPSALLILVCGVLTCVGAGAYRRLNPAIRDVAAS